jgi:hypothetical protein
VPALLGNPAAEWLDIEAGNIIRNRDGKVRCQRHFATIVHHDCKRSALRQPINNTCSRKFEIGFPYQI